MPKKKNDIDSAKTQAEASKKSEKELTEELEKAQKESTEKLVPIIPPPGQGAVSPPGPEGYEEEA